MSAVLQFVDSDRTKTLFPLETPAAFIKHGEEQIREFLDSDVFDKDSADGFQKATVDYVLKDDQHKRRVLVLDPLATFFLYDLVWRNRSSLSVPRSGDRRFYGFGFDSKQKRIDGFRDYHSFRRSRYSLKGEHQYQLRVDIFNCFNSFYHHKLASDFRTRVPNADDGDRLGQFLREINSGDSIWCFPQGLYPAKVIGNQYLRFLEESRKISAKYSLRFLDDVYLYSDSKARLYRDLLNIQEVLGAHYLALNDRKTMLSSSNEAFGQVRIDDIKKELLHKREKLGGSYDEDDEEVEKKELLTEVQETYLLELIEDRNAASEDIELGLALLRDSSPAFKVLIPRVLKRSPYLLRELHRAAAGNGFDDESVELLWAEMGTRLKRKDDLTSHELFWFVRLLVDRLEFDRDVAERLLEIAESPHATPVVRAAVLEHESLDHGFAEFKERTLNEASLGIVTHAVLYGLRNMEKARRNQSFKYVGRAGPHWRLMTQIASKF